MKDDDFFYNATIALYGGTPIGWGGEYGAAARTWSFGWMPPKTEPPVDTSWGSTFVEPANNSFVSADPYYPFETEEQYLANQQYEREAAERRHAELERRNRELQRRIAEAGGHDRYYFDYFGPVKQGWLVAGWKLEPYFDELDDRIDSPWFRYAVPACSSILVMLTALTYGASWLLIVVTLVVGLFVPPGLLKMAKLTAMATLAAPYAAYRSLLLAAITTWDGIVAIAHGVTTLAARILLAFLRCAGVLSASFCLYWVVSLIAGS